MGAVAGILMLALGLRPAAAQMDPTPPPTRQVVVYFFWGDGCPHCAAAKPFLEQLRQRYPGLEVRAYEVWYSEANRDLFARMAGAYGFEAKSVPTFFLGNQHWVGYSEQTGPVLERAVAACARAGCPDAGAGIIVFDSAPLFIGPVAPPMAAEPEPVEPAAPAMITLPLLGAVSLENQSLTVSTILIAFVDGVNPCSMWALMTLLAITLHTGSRRKVAIIGLVYITVTACIYALFIAGMFTLFTVARLATWLQLLVAATAAVFGLINIKDYFFFKQGPSLTISDTRKPGLIRRMRRLLDASQSFGGLVGATVVLAAGVSLVEFSCTAGFPLIWTNLLAARGVGPAAFVMLLLIYLVIYQLDEFVVFGGAVATLRASRLEEKHGRTLKLAGGMLMLALALVMLINPALMNDIGNAIVVFGGAMAATAFIISVRSTRVAARRSRPQR